MTAAETTRYDFPLKKIAIETHRDNVFMIKNIDVSNTEFSTGNKSSIFVSIFRSC